MGMVIIIQERRKGFSHLIWAISFFQKVSFKSLVKFLFVSVNADSVDIRYLS
jgi:hypothetical protein